MLLVIVVEPALTSTLFLTISVRILVFRARVNCAASTALLTNESKTVTVIAFNLRK